MRKADPRKKIGVKTREDKERKSGELPQKLKKSTGSVGCRTLSMKKPPRAESVQLGSCLGKTRGQAHVVSGLSDIMTSGELSEMRRRSEQSEAILKRNDIFRS